MAFTNLILSKPNSEGGSVKGSCSVTGASATLQTSTFAVERLSQATITVKTANVSGTSPTLNVYLQKLLPDGSTWHDIGSFTQINGNGTRVASVVSGGNKEEALSQAALAAGTFNSVAFGAWWRFNCVIAGTSPSFDITIALEGLA